MSSELARTASEASKGISASVARLENLFDKLYADTFSMMRDTVSDMRRHIWPEETKDIDRLSEEAERRADEKVRELKGPLIQSYLLFCDAKRSRMKSLEPST